MQRSVIARSEWRHFITVPDLFHGVPQQDMRKIASLYTEKWFPLAKIFQEGEPADCLYILRRGMVKDGFLASLPLSVTKNLRGQRR